MARFLNQSNQFVIPNFLGGIHEEVDSSLLKVNEASKAQNCDISKGILKSCKGITSAYQTNSVPKALMTYYRNGTNNLMAVMNGNLYQKTDSITGWTLVGAGLDANADRYDFINNNIDNKDILVFANGVDKVKIYDGVDTRNLKILGKVSTEAADNSISGKYLIMHYERLWVADDNSLYASSVTRDGFDIEDFTTPTDETEVNQHGVEISMYGADGKIIGLSVVFDDIIIWKEKSIHKIFGSNPDNYEKINFSAKGGISDKSVAVHETGAFFIDHSGIYIYNGTNPILISRPIEDIWKSLDVNKLSKAVGFIHDNKYVLAVCEGSSTTNNLIIEYDISNQNFMVKRGMNIEAAVDFNRKAYIATGSNNIYEYNSGNTFNGTSIDCFWETGYTDLGIPEATKEVDTIYLMASGTGSVKITITTEKGSRQKIQQLTEADKVYSIATMIRGKIFKIRIENVNGSSFSLKGFKLLYENDYD